MSQQRSNTARRSVRNAVAKMFRAAFKSYEDQIPRALCTVDRLEERMMLSVDLNQFNQLPAAVNDVKSAVTSMLDANPLPVLGNKLSQNISAFAQQFSNLANTLTGDLQNAENSVSDLTTALKSPDLGLKNFDGSTLSTFASTDTDVEYQAMWKGSVISIQTPPIAFNLGLAALGLNITSNLIFDASVTPTFKIDFGANTNGFFIDTSKTSFQLAATITIDSSSPGLSGKLANLLEFQATDATSNNSVYIPTNQNPVTQSPSSLTATFNASLMSSGSNDLTITDLNSLDASGLNMNLSGGLNLDLAMELGFALGSSDVTENLPTLYADLDVGWQFPGVNLSPAGVTTDSSTYGNSPTIAFNNVAVDFGSFITKFVVPIVDHLNDIADKVKPLIDFINKPAPVFNDFGILSDAISGELNNTDGSNPYGDAQQGLIQNGVITMGDLIVYGGDEAPVGEGRGDYSSIVQFAQQFQTLYNLVDPLSNFDPGGRLDLGSFNILGDTRNESDLTGNSTSDSMTDQQVASEADSMLGEGGSDVQDALAPAGSTPGVQVPGSGPGAPASGIDFPILRDPTQIFQLFLGNKDVSLFTYTSQQLNIPLVTFSQEITVYWPYAVDLRGNLGGNNVAFDLTGQIIAGYDTQGFADFGQTQNPTSLLDGFYLDDSSKLNFNFGIDADGAVNLYVLSSGLGGGLTGTVTLSVADPNKATDGGHMHLPDILTAFENSIFGPVNVSGHVSFVLNWFVTINLGFTTQTEQINLITEKLLDFSSANATGDIPVLAHYANGSSGTLILNMGPNAGARGAGDTSDDDEDFSVSLRKVNPDGTEKVTVSALGENIDYDEVSDIQAFGGAGSNTIDIEQGMDVPVQLYAAFAPSSNTLTNGTDTIDDEGSGRFTIYGSSGADNLRVNTGNSQDPSQGGLIDGAGGSDTITANGPIASGARDTLYAGDDFTYNNAAYGDNDSMSSTIVGGPGNDTIQTYSRPNEHSAADYIDSGGGNDTITQAGDDFQQDTVVAHDGNDGSILFEPGAGNYQNTVEMYGVGGEETINALDTNTIFGSGPHGLFVQAETGVFGSGPTETITALNPTGTSGVNELVLDATAGNPNANANAATGSLSYAPPAGIIHVNVGDLTLTNVVNIDVNSDAATFPATNANPTILTITGPSNIHRAEFSTAMATVTGNSNGSSQSFSGTAFGASVYTLPQGEDVESLEEGVSFGETNGDQVIYNAGPGSPSIYLYAGPATVSASFTFNACPGDTENVYAAALSQTTTINQDGAFLSVYVGDQDNFGGGLRSTTLSQIAALLDISGLAFDNTQPNGYDGSLTLTLDDSSQSSAESATVSSFLDPTTHTTIGSVTGFGMTNGIFFPQIVKPDIILGSGNDTITVQHGNTGFTPSATITAGFGQAVIQAVASTAPVIFIGGSAPDTVYGSGEGDSLVGGTGADAFYEQTPQPAGNPDTIIGGTGNDTIGASGNNESINGGAGNDTITYSALSTGPSSPTIVAGTGNDAITCYGGSPVIYAANLSGGQTTGGGNDIVQGTASTATIYGGAGSDTFYLGVGSTVSGLVPNDYGPTTLYFGSGAAALYAAAGAETLYCNNSSSTDQLAGASSLVPVMTPLVIQSGTLADTIGLNTGQMQAVNYDVTVVAGATLSISFGAAIGSLTGAGSVFFAPGSLADALTTGIDNASTVFNGVISGNGSLTKSGTGTFTLTNSNTYTSTTTVNGGLLQDGANNALPTGTDLTSATGGTFDLNSFNQTIGSLARGGSVTLGTGTLTTGGDNAITTFSGVISGTGSVVKNGTSTWTISGSNTYSGPTLLNSGTIQTAATNSTSPASDLTIAAPATLSLTSFNQSIGSLAGAGTVALGIGTLTAGVDNASTTFTGTIGGLGGLTKAGSGVFICAIPVQYGPTLVQAGTMRLIQDTSPFPTPGLLYTFNDPNDTGSTVTNDGTLANENGTIANGSEVSGVAGAPGGGRVLQLNDPGYVSMSAVPIGASWTFGAWVSGLSTSTADYRDLFHSGNDQVDSPIMIQTGGNALGSGIFGGGAFVGSTYKVDGTGASIGTSDPNVTTGWHEMVAVGSSGSTVFYIDGVAVASINKQFVGGFGVGTIGDCVNHMTQFFSTYLSDVIMYPSTALTAAQVQTLYMNNGVPKAMPSAVSVASGATFDINNLSPDIGSLAGAGSVLLGTGTLTTGTDNTNTTFAGAASGSGSITKVGFGAWTVTGNNTYTGTPTLVSGTVNFNGFPSLGNGTGILFKGGTLQYASGNTADISTRTITFGPSGGTIDTNGNNVTLVNAIGNNGVGGFTKTGAGILLLQSAGTWKGSTTVAGGTLRAGIINLLPAGNDLIITTGGTFDLNNLNQSIGSLSGDSTGLVTLEAATLTSGSGGNTNNTTYSGAISGTGPVVKIGASILTLAGNNAFSGGVFINESASSINGLYGLSISSDNNLGASTNAVTFNSPGGVLFTTANMSTGRSILLSTTNVNFSDYINVLAGTTLTANGAIANTGSIPAPLGKNGTGTLVLNAVNTWGSVNSASDLVINDGVVRLGVANAIPDVLVSFNSPAARTAILDLNGFSQRLAGLSGGFTGGVQLGSINNSTSTMVTLTIDGSSQLEYDGSIKGNVALVINGSQNFGFTPLINTGSNYSGGTTILSGNTKIAFLTTLNGDGSIATGPFGTGSVTLGSTTGSNNAILTVNLCTLDNSLTVVGGSTGKVVLDGANIGVYGSTVVLQRNVFMTGNETFNGVISGTGNISIDNAGLGDDGGTTTFNAGNTYIGTTTIGNGSLKMGTANALPVNTAVTIVVGSTNAGLNLNNFNTTIGSLTEASGGDSTHGAVTLGTATLTTGSDNSSTAFAGVIAGTGSVLKVGTGSWTLAGANTFTGALNISNGVVTVGDGTTHGSLAGSIVLSGTTVNFNRSDTLTYAGTITGTGSLVEAGAGTLILPVPTFTGTTTIQTGTFQFSSTEPTPVPAMPSSVTVNLGANFNVNNIGTGVGSLSGGGNVQLGSAQLTTGSDNTNTTLDGILSGSGGITKIGSGTFTLTGVDLYTGPTNVNAGNMQIAAPTPPTLPAPALLYTFNNANDTGTIVTNDGTAVNKNGTLSNATEVAASTTDAGAPIGARVLKLNTAAGEVLINQTSGQGISLAGGEWTASLWFDNLDPVSNWRTIFHSSIPSGVGSDAVATINTGTYNLGTYVNNGFVGSNYFVNGSGTPPVNVNTGWHDITVVGSGGKTIFYIDGSQFGSASAQSLSDIYSIANFYNIPTQAMAACIADVSIYQTALSATQVQALYVTQQGSSAGGSLASNNVTVAAGAGLAVNDNTGLSSATSLTSSGVTAFAANSGSGILPRTLASITIPLGGLVAIQTAANHANRSVLITGALNIGGVLDLTDNDMVIHNGNLNALNAEVAQGYNNGLWNGISGIESSAAASDPAHLTAVGVIQNTVDGTASGTTLYSTFAAPAITVGASDVLIKYTYYGDANLDGKVDGSDYSRIDSSYLHPITGWFNGDYNYDASLNGSDYTLMDNAFNSQGASLAAQVAPADIAPRESEVMGKQPGNHQRHKTAATPTALSAISSAIPVQSAPFSDLPIDLAPPFTDGLEDLIDKSHRRGDLSHLPNALR